jgi:hypothetical protein
MEPGVGSQSATEKADKRSEARDQKEPGKLETFKVVTDGLFKKLFAIYVFTGAGAFLWKASFDDKTIMNLVVGFVIGTLLSTILLYIYGSSQSSQDKDKRLAEAKREG